MKKALFLLSVLGVCFFIFLIITNPSVCVEGAVSGLLLCGNVIIPSLFPFTVCVLFILKSGILENLKFADGFSQKIFKFNSQMLAIFLLSLIGGYPLGAKILNEAEETPENASVMLNYCVNAGPAFIILAVGCGCFGSKKIGYILFVSHVLSALLLALFFKKFLTETKHKAKKASLNLVDNFILSTSLGASTVLNICAFVILFSTIVKYISFYSQRFHFLKFFSYILEVTNAITLTDNVIFVSFLLGFGGISVWCQVMSVSQKIKMNFPIFITSRIIHGILSAVSTYLLLKIFKISVSTVSNGIDFSFSAYTSSLAVAISLITMGIVLIISLYSKKCAGNMLEDLV